MKIIEDNKRVILVMRFYCFDVWAKICEKYMKNMNNVLLEKRFQLFQPKVIASIPQRKTREAHYHLKVSNYQDGSFSS